MCEYEGKESWGGGGGGGEGMRLPPCNPGEEISLMKK